MNCSPTIDDPGRLKEPRTPLILPEALIMAILSLPPDKPRVRFRTLEYFLLPSRSNQRVLSITPNIFHYISKIRHHHKPEVTY